MKEVYATWETEYEAGFGQRDEGVHFSESLDDLNKEIKRIHAIGDAEGFFRCSEPVKIFVDPKVWATYADKGSVHWEKKLPEGFFKKA